MRINITCVIHAKQTRRRHVYADLQPYMCLWESCSLGLRMFSTRHEWLQHEQDYHGKAWSCSLGCPNYFDDRDTMEKHYLNHHSAQNYDINKILQASETRRSNPGAYQCPLCSAVIPTTKAYGQHTGRHLRELSLFALPTYAPDEVAEDQESDDGSHRESGLTDEDSDTNSERGSVILENPIDVPAQVPELSYYIESHARGRGYQPPDWQNNVEDENVENDSRTRNSASLIQNTVNYPAVTDTVDIEERIKSIKENVQQMNNERKELWNNTASGVLKSLENHLGEQQKINQVFNGMLENSGQRPDENLDDVMKRAREASQNLMVEVEKAEEKARLLMPAKQKQKGNWERPQKTKLEEPPIARIQAGGKSQRKLGTEEVATLLKISKRELEKAWKDAPKKSISEEQRDEDLAPLEKQSTYEGEEMNTRTKEAAAINNKWVEERANYLRSSGNVENNEEIDRAKVCLTIEARNSFN